MFLAFRYQPGFGPLAVAYATANIASALPLTSGGLGVIESHPWWPSPPGFGAPRATAVVATLAYRLVSYWLLPPLGVVAYLRLRLRAVDRRPDNPRPAGPAQVPAPGPADDGDG